MNKKKNGVQTELPGMLKRTALGDKAIEYLNGKGDLDSVKDELIKIKSRLSN